MSLFPLRNIPLLLSTFFSPPLKIDYGNNLSELDEMLSFKSFKILKFPNCVTDLQSYFTKTKYVFRRKERFPSTSQEVIKNLEQNSYFILQSWWGAYLVPLALGFMLVLLMTAGWLVFPNMHTGEKKWSVPHFDVMHWSSHAKTISVQKISKQTRPVVKLFLFFTPVIFLLLF